MSQETIFAPMGAQALLTFIVLMFVYLRRVGAHRAGQVQIKDFRFGESDAVPGHVSIPNRNYMNLLELPTLFYPVCLMFFVAGRVTPLVLATAWSYVALRAIHSAIHLGTNNIMHRLTAFAASIAVLAALWLEFFVRLA
jgi:hypothetical protein